MQGYGKSVIKHQGHYTLGHFLTRQAPSLAWLEQLRKPLVVVAVIRNPVQRFVSQIRQADRKNPRLGLEALMVRAANNLDVVFQPQWQYLAETVLADHIKTDRRLWPMDDLSEALNFVAGKPVSIHANQAPEQSEQISVDEILHHPLFDVLMDSPEHYQPDFKLWVMACRALARNA